jgi:hypothetical protein
MIAMMLEYMYLGEKVTMMSLMDITLTDGLNGRMEEIKQI